MKIKDKIIVVTCAGNGLGREIVFSLLKQGASVAAIDVNMHALKATKSLSGISSNQLTLHQSSATNPEGINILVAEIINIHGCVDGLVNYSEYISPEAELTEPEYAALQKLMERTYYHNLYLTDTLLPLLLLRSEAHIVNILDMSGFIPIPGCRRNGAAIAAIKSSTENLQAELKDSHVIVSMACLGIRLKKQDKKLHINGRASKSGIKEMIQTPPSIAAEIIIKGMEKNKRRIYTGKYLQLMIGLHRLYPDFALKIITKKHHSIY